jgi:hypothetical protein
MRSPACRFGGLREGDVTVAEYEQTAGGRQIPVVVLETA